MLVSREVSLDHVFLIFPGQNPEAAERQSEQPTARGGARRLDCLTPAGHTRDQLPADSGVARFQKRRKIWPIARRAVGAEMPDEDCR